MPMFSCCTSESTHGPLNRLCAIVAGNARIEEAKITGMTPPVFTLSGMCVLDPPYIRRPTTRLAYCTVTRRCPRSTKIIAATTRSEEHTSELQSQSNLVCRLLLEKKKTDT